MDDFALYLYRKNHGLTYLDLTGRPYIPSWRVTQDMWYDSIYNEFQDSRPAE